MTYMVNNFSIIKKYNLFKFRSTVIKLPFERLTLF